MEKKFKKLSLFIRYFIIYGIVLFGAIIALILIGVNIQRAQLKQKALLLSNEVIAFNNWFNNAPQTMNHIIASQELAKSYPEKTQTFKIAGIHNKNIDSFESEALKRFKEDEGLNYIDKKEGVNYRYVQPLKTNNTCIKCHKNYKPNEIAGIIAVDMKNVSILPDFEIKGALTYFSIIMALSLFISSFLWFEFRIIQPLIKIDSTLQEFKTGNYDARIPISTKDELGEIAFTFNTTLDKLVTLIQTDAERKQMQKNILQFLETLSAASEGDLSKRLEVTPDIFGSLGDAFNLMVEGLSDLIEKVKGSVEEVNNESNRMMQVLKQLESGASSQMIQVKRATQSVNQAAMSANEITDKTKKAEEISINASNAIVNGGKAVDSAIEGVQLIRLTIQAINKRMKYLSERLMEIVTISHLINEIANRTNILAINASIEATRAGEQGKGFVVISDEIRSLAERASKSSKQITDIINAVQTESTIVTKHLDEGTKYIEIGTKTAADTETAFKEIEKTIKDMGVIISEISSSAEGQKQLTSDAVSSIEAVQMVSVQVLNLVHDFTEISKSLTETSNMLISSIERFRLPE